MSGPTGLELDAAGGVGEDEGAELDLLLEGIYAGAGLDLRGHERDALLRRVRAHVAAEALAGGLAALRASALDDPAGLERLLVALARREEAMFEDPAFHRALRREVLPLLRTYPSINVWHVGCAAGEQAYATAIALREEGLLGRARIYATDVNETLLTRAREGSYALAALERESPRYLEGGGRSALAEYYAAAGDRAVMRPLLRDRITFFQHDLATDASFNEFQLVLCRGLLPELGHPLQQRLYALLHESLCRLGVLALGPGEALGAHPQRDCYQAVDAEGRLHRRVR